MGDFCQKIQPLDSGVYWGAYSPNPKGTEITTPETIQAFEGATTNLDITALFVTLSNPHVPQRVIDYLQSKKGKQALFLKVEPKAKTFSLKQLAKYKVDKYANLVRLLQKLNKAGIPVFLSLGHEMNKPWYSWGQPHEMYTPEFKARAKEYQQAFRQFVTELRSKTCFTSVWNPDTGFPAAPYYPGDDVVDWVGIDGYNWGGKLDVNTVFHGINYLKTLNKPLMIGETADDVRDRKSIKGTRHHSSQVIDYLNKDNPDSTKPRVKAVIWLDRDKPERGEMRYFSIFGKGRKLRKKGQALKAALARHSTLFKDPIKTAATTPNPGAPVVLPYVPPPGFDKGAFSADDLRTENKREIKKAIFRLAKAAGGVQTASDFGDADDFLSAIQDDETDAFSSAIVQWMLQRENGTPKPALLKSILQHKGSGHIYWKNKFAFLIVSGTSSKAERATIAELGFTPPKDNSKAERYKFLVTLFENYNKLANSDPLLKGEMQLQLAIFAPDKATKLTHLTQAERLLAYTLNNPRQIYRIIFKRKTDLRGTTAFARKFALKEAKFYRGHARTLTGQILLFRAAEEQNPVEIMKKLVLAMKYLKKSVQDLDKLHFTSVKRLAAECYLLMGFVITTYGDRFDVQAMIRDQIHNPWPWLVPQNNSIVSAKAYRSIKTDSRFYQDEFFGRLTIKGLCDPMQADGLISNCSVPELNKAVKNPATATKIMAKHQAIIDKANNVEVKALQKKVSTGSLTALESARLNRLLIEIAYVNVCPRSEPELALFQAASALLTGAPRESVVEWAKQYQASVKDVSKQPIWFKQITLYAKLWSYNMRMARIKELRTKEETNGIPKEYLVKQEAELREIVNGTKDDPGLIGILKDFGVKIESGETLAQAVVRTLKTNKTNGILLPDEIAAVATSLADNLSLQAIIAMDFARKDGATGYVSLFNQARGILEYIIIPSNPGKAPVKANAHLTLAKIHLIEASKEPTKAQADAHVTKGLVYLKGAFTKDHKGVFNLKGSTLSQAWQTKAELLAALKQFRKAERILVTESLRIYPRNYAAQAVLGDVRNWQGQHAAAIAAYSLVPVYSASYDRAQIGLKEATMRKGDVYARADIQQMEFEAIYLFDSQPPGSPLIPRAIQGLTEAYRTDEDFQERVIHMGNKLVNAQAVYALDPKGTVKHVDKILDYLPSSAVAALEDKFTAEIYLRTAEALLWRKEFDEARRLVTAMPGQYQSGLDKRPELAVLKKLIPAEAEARDDKEAAPLLAVINNPQNRADLIKEKDPDLLARLTLDHVEAYNLEKEFKTAAAVGEKTLALVATKTADPKKPFDLHLNEPTKGPSNIYRTLFADRRYSYEKFMLTHYSFVIDAYIGKKELIKAETALLTIIAATNKGLSTVGHNPKLKFFAKLYRQFQAKAYLELAHIYSYNWPGKLGVDKEEHNEARKHYWLALDRYLGKLNPKQLAQDPAKIKATLDSRTDFSKKDLLIIGQTFLGLGETHRWGEDLVDTSGKDQKRAKLLDAAEVFYYDAIAVSELLPQKSEKALILLYKAYAGLAQLADQRGQKSKAARLMRQAQSYVKQIKDQEIIDEARLLASKIFQPLGKAEVKFQTDGKHTEIRTSLTAQFPIGQYFDLPVLDSITPSVTLHVDQAISTQGQTGAYAGYAGLNIRLADMIRRGASWMPYDLSVVLDTKFRFAQHLDDGTTDMQFFRQPDFSGSAYIGTPYVALTWSNDLYYNKKDQDLNTYYLNAMTKLHDEHQLGFSWIHYLFTNSGEKQTRQELTLEYKFQKDIGPITFRTQVGYPYFQYKGAFLSDLFNDNLEDKRFPGYYSSENLDAPGSSIAESIFASFKLGAGADLRFYDFVMSLDCAVSHQHDAPTGHYTSGSCNLGIRY